MSKNKKGAVASVEFSESLEKNTVPSSSSAFFETYLDISSSDEFE